MNPLKLVWTLVLCLCVGTVLAQALVAAVLFPKMKLNSQRISQIVSIAQGNDIAPAKTVEKPTAPQLETEQASYQEVVEARAVKYRNLELREQQLRNNVTQVQSDESKITDDIKKNKQLVESFQAQLENVRKTSTSKGMDDVLRTLISLKPKQAKELILDMLDKKEIDAVVELIKQMPDKKRANIIGEFKGDDEEKISEVLRRIREGEPDNKAVNTAEEKMKKGT
jgi:hypothetical protein